MVSALIPPQSQYRYQCVWVPVEENLQTTVLLFWCPQIQELFFHVQDHIWCFSAWQFDFNLSVGGSKEKKKGGLFALHFQHQQYRGVILRCSTLFSQSNWPLSPEMDASPATNTPHCMWVERYNANCLTADFMRGQEDVVQPSCMTSTKNTSTRRFW